MLIYISTLAKNVFAIINLFKNQPEKHCIRQYSFRPFITPEFRIKICKLPFSKQRLFFMFMYTLLHYNQISPNCYQAHNYGEVRRSQTHSVHSNIKNNAETFTKNPVYLTHQDQDIQFNFDYT